MEMGPAASQALAEQLPALDSETVSRFRAAAVAAEMPVRAVFRLPDSRQRQ
jgi:hypothetical protein